MAELLVCAVDQPGALRYKQGDIVVVAPDGHQWSFRESLPTFWQITVVSLVDGDRATFLEDVRDPLVPAFLLRRRKRFIDITQLSALAQSTLVNTGRATVLRLALLNALTLRT